MDIGGRLRTAAADSDGRDVSGATTKQRGGVRLVRWRSFPSACQCTAPLAVRCSARPAAAGRLAVRCAAQWPISTCPCCRSSVPSPPLVPRPLSTSSSRCACPRRSSVAISTLRCGGSAGRSDPAARRKKRKKTKKIKGKRPASHSSGPVDCCWGHCQRHQQRAQRQPTRSHARMNPTAIPALGRVETPTSVGRRNGGSARGRSFVPLRQPAPRRLSLTGSASMRDDGRAQVGDRRWTRVNTATSRPPHEQKVAATW